MWFLLLAVAAALRAQRCPKNIVFLTRRLADATPIADHAISEDVASVTDENVVPADANAKIFVRNLHCDTSTEDLKNASKTASHVPCVDSTSIYVDIRRYTSVYVDIRRHTSTYVGIW